MPAHNPLPPGLACGLSTHTTLTLNIPPALAEDNPKPATRSFAGVLSGTTTPPPPLSAPNNATSPVFPPAMFPSPAEANLKPFVRKPRYSPRADVCPKKPLAHDAVDSTMLCTDASVSTKQCALESRPSKSCPSSVAVAGSMSLHAHKSRPSPVAGSMSLRAHKSRPSPVAGSMSLRAHKSRPSPVARSMSLRARKSRPSLVAGSMSLRAHKSRPPSSVVGPFKLRARFSCPSRHLRRALMLGEVPSAVLRPFLVPRLASGVSRRRSRLASRPGLGPHQPGPRRARVWLCLLRRCRPTWFVI